MFKKTLMYKTVLAAVLSTTLSVQPLMLAKALADGGDFSLDFTAAAPLTYNHTTGGGAYNDRTVGRDKDIVESLEGGDFACGDLVTFLTQITVGSGAPQQAVELLYEFTAHSTGQQGVALGDIVNVQINYGVGDIGINDDLGSTANLVSEQILNKPIFTKGSILEGKIQVTDLEANETVVLRIDVRILCNGQSATGNMQARLAGAAVVSPIGETGTINVGDQTIPFKRVGDICKDCPPPK